MNEWEIGRRFGWFPWERVWVVRLYLRARWLGLKVSTVRQVSTTSCHLYFGIGCLEMWVVSTPQKYRQFEQKWWPKGQYSAQKRFFTEGLPTMDEWMGGGK